MMNLMIFYDVIFRSMKDRVALFESHESLVLMTDSGDLSNTTNKKNQIKFKPER